MFFYLSKLLTFLISPTLLIVLALCMALFTRNSKRKKWLLTGSFIALLIFSNPFLISQLVKQWELRDSAFKKTKHYGIAIVLSGFMTRDEDSGRLTFGGDVDRLTEGLSLYRKGLVDKILISGGSGSLTKNSREATLAREFLISSCNVPDSVILIDTVSRNSFENAVESKKILVKGRIQSALLITSAFHMRRAKGCFDKLNVPVDTYSTDPSPKQRYYPTDLVVPATSSIAKWEQLLHEIVGVIMYKLKGYS